MYRVKTVGVAIQPFAATLKRSKVQGVQSPEVKGVLHRSQSNQKTSKKLYGQCASAIQLKPKIEKNYLRKEICG